MARVSPLGPWMLHGRPARAREMEGEDGRLALGAEQWLYDSVTESDECSHLANEHGIATEWCQDGITLLEHPLPGRA